MGGSMRELLLISSVVVALAAHGTYAGRKESPVGRQIALTFDDLPATTGASCDTSYIREVTEKLTAVLESRGAPAMGLATPDRACMTTALLRETLGRWQQIGATIGNHSATHPDLNSTPAATYVAGIERAQAMIDSAVRTDDRWFRHPFLHSGNTPAKKQAVDAYLSANGYRLAPVTVDNQEFVYAAVYAAAKSTGDAELADRVADAYVRHLEDAIAYYERLSVAVFDREIPQVLLLHANLLNAEHVGRAMDMLAARGYAFVSMPEALADSAYARPDTYVGPRGLSWLQRWALEAGVRVPPEPREAPWVASAFQRLR